MKRWYEGSLLVRAGLAVSIITLLALVSAVTGVLIAWLSAGEAAAINAAGSLRMQTYRLSWQLDREAAPDHIQAMKDRFEQRLLGPELTAVLDDEDNRLDQAYRALVDRWTTQLAPALASQDAATFLGNADDFVTQLDEFVLQLQQRSERKRAWQQMVQGTTLVITIVVLLVGLHQLRYGVLMPMRELLRSLTRFREGDLTTRVTHRSPDELGHVAGGFNAMADAIEESHRTLEQRVAQETERLSRANAALQLLYRSSRHIATQPATAESIEAMLDNFQRSLSGLALTLCLHGDGAASTDTSIAIQGRKRRTCPPDACESCPTHARRQVVCQVSSQQHAMGELAARFDDGHVPESWETELIQALADLIGTALSLERRRLQEHQLVLFEERAIIARELHDSLAQALSYMKLQVSRLQTLMRRGANAETLQPVTDEIRDGLNDAYRQLRELLVTFRLKIREGGFHQALAETIDEFARRADFTLDTRIRPFAFSLSAAEEIHVLQIAREALSNCVRHAGASTVRVSLQPTESGLELVIEDDGAGLPPAIDAQHHHGLSIMRERARNLDGNLAIEPSTPRGTRVRLTFRPRFLAAHESSPDSTTPFTQLSQEPR
ncbi:ATP-binding protein [Pseudomonas sp. Marseille-QA0892]